MEVVKQQKALNKALSALKKGKVIVCPTDTVYGFLSVASDKKAVEKIFKLKRRPRSKPLPVFVNGLKMAKELAEINEKQEKTLNKYWPGKYTFVLKALNGGTIALRIPEYKFLNDLLKKINKPLAQTSANISGQPALTKISDIIEQFNKSDILVINGGDLPKNQPSAIIDFTLKRLTRLR